MCLPLPGKLLEKLVHKQYYHYLENHNLINNNQVGFRKKRNTIQAIDNFLSIVYEAINDNEYVIATYLDFSKAFDTVNHIILKEKLKSTKIDNLSFKWFESYLDNRYQRVLVKGMLSNIEPSNYGVPQGSTLGPLLYILYVNDMVKSINSGSMITFADDTVIINCGRVLNETIKSSEQNLERVSLWCRDHKLSLNVDKTKSMYFHKSNKIGEQRNLIFENQEIETVKEYKYLGLIINQDLNFNSHIKAQINSLNGKLYHFRKIRKYIPERTAIVIYKVLIAPIMKYANMFLCSGPQSLL